MGKVGTVKLKVHPISLKSVIRTVPRDKKEKEMLVEDLTKMEYKDLLLESWSLKSEATAQEFQHERSNEWEGMIWRALEKMDSRLLGGSIQLPKGGKRDGRKN